MKKNLQSHIEGSVSVLNPNQAMAQYLIETCESLPGGPEPSPAIEIRVVSRIKWDESKISAIGAIIEKTSPDTAEALRNYSWIPELFTW